MNEKNRSGASHSGSNCIDCYSFVSCEVERVIGSEDELDVPPCSSVIIMLKPGQRCVGLIARLLLKSTRASKPYESTSVVLAHVLPELFSVKFIANRVDMLKEQFCHGVGPFLHVSRNHHSFRSVEVEHRFAGFWSRLGTRHIVAEVWVDQLALEKTRTSSYHCVSQVLAVLNVLSVTDYFLYFPRAIAARVSSFFSTAKSGSTSNNVSTVDPLYIFTDSMLRMIFSLYSSDRCAAISGILLKIYYIMI